MTGEEIPMMAARIIVQWSVGSRAREMDREMEKTHAQRRAETE